MLQLAVLGAALVVLAESGLLGADTHTPRVFGRVAARLGAWAPLYVAVAVPAVEEAVYRWAPLLLDLPPWCYAVVQVMFWVAHYPWRYNARLVVEVAGHTLILASLALVVWWASLPYHVAVNTASVLSWRKRLCGKVMGCVNGKR